MKKKIAFYVFMVLSLIATAFGIMYIFRENIMNYHIAFLGLNKDELNAFSPKLLELYLALMKVAGSCMVAIGVGTFLITLIPYKKEEAWTWWVLLVLFGASLTPMYFVTHYIAGKIPAGQSKPPVDLVLIMLGLLAIALILSFPYNLKKKKQTS